MPERTYDTTLPASAPSGDEQPSYSLDDLLPEDLRRPLTLSSLVLLLDEQGRVRAWPSTIAQWTGRSEPDALGRTLTGIGLGLAAHDELDHVVAEAQRLGKATRRAWLETGAGVVIDVVLELRALSGPHGRPYFEAVILVPELARADTASEPMRMRIEDGKHGWLEALFQFSQDAVLLTDMDGRLLAINPAGLRMLAYPHDGSTGEGPNWRTVSLACEADLRSVIQERSRGGEDTTEVMLTRQDGTQFPAWITVRLFRDHLGHEHAALIVRDLTERRRVNDALRLSEERFRVALLHAPVVMAMLDTRGKTLWFHGPHAYLRPEQVIGKRIDEVPAMQNGAEIQAAILRVVQSRHAETMEGHLRVPGLERVYDVSLEPWLRPDGEIEGVTLVGVDVSERVVATRALHDSEQRFRRAFEDSGVGIGLVSLDGQVARVNPAMVRMLGYSEQELLQMNVVDLSVPSERPMSRDLLARVLADRQPQRATLHKQCKNGRVLTVQLTRSLVNADDGTPAYVIDQIQDVTLEQELQERVRQAQKMEAVGRLAGGVAHDFNNMLTAIRGGAELLRQSLEGDPRLEDLALIEAAADRAARLTTELLGFGGRQLLQVARHDVAHLLSQFQPLLRQAAVPSCRLVLDVDPQAGAVEVDPNHLEQALVNLVLNARDAMLNGGEITLTTRREVLDAETAGTLQLMPGPHVRITVRDEGEGMDEKTRAHLFEPFFTTKAKGKGTGLGLAMVYGFIMQSAGQISVDSAPGRGSTFHLYLPAARAVTVEPPPPPIEKAPTETGTVLIVDDEPGVRYTVCRLLQHAGFSVLTASSGEEALSVLEDHPEVDALLTDVVMPQMDGRTLMTEALRRRPGLAVALMSGYTDDTVVREDIASSTVAFLHKPFRSADLYAVVGALMEARVNAP